MLGNTRTIKAILSIYPKREAQYFISGLFENEQITKSYFCGKCDDMLLYRLYKH